MGRFLDRLKNFGSKILTGIKRVGEKVIPVIRKVAPFAAKILKHVPLPGAATAGQLIEEHGDKVLDITSKGIGMIPNFKMT